MSNTLIIEEKSVNLQSKTITNGFTTNKPT